ALLAIANAGFVHAFPLTAFGSGQAQLDILLAQNTSLQKRYADTTADYDKNLARVEDPATKPTQQAAILRETSTPFLGAAFVVIAQFRFTKPSEIATVFGDRDQLLNYIGTQGVPLPIDEWLHGVALVRPTMHTFGLARTLTETFEGKFGDCRPIQLPYRVNDN